MLESSIGIMCLFSQDSMDDFRVHFIVSDDVTFKSLIRMKRVNIAPEYLVIEVGPIP